MQIIDVFKMLKILQIGSSILKMRANVIGIKFFGPLCTLSMLLIV